MKPAKDFFEKIEIQLGELGNKIDDMSFKLKSEAKTKYDETANSLRAHIDESLQKAGTDLESQVREWESKMKELKAKGKEDARKEYEEIINNIRPKIDELNAKIKDLKKAGREAADELRIGTRSALSVLKDSITKAKEKFKQTAD